MCLITITGENLSTGELDSSSSGYNIYTGDNSHSEAGSLYNINPQQFMWGAQNQLYTQQQSTIDTMAFTHATFSQSDRSSDGGGDFECSKKIRVEDMLLHLDQMKYTFRNKSEMIKRNNAWQLLYQYFPSQVYNYLLDVINAFKSTSISSLNFAKNQLYKLLREHFEVIMSFTTFCSPSYETEEHLNHPEYDFEVIIVLHDLTETDIATLSQDQNVAASSSIPVKGPSCLYISQRLSTTNRSIKITIPNSKLNEASSPPPLMPKCTGEMSDSHIMDARTQCSHQTPNQSPGITENRGQKRKRN